MDIAPITHEAAHARARACDRAELKVGRFVVPYSVYGRGSRFIVCVNGAQQTRASWRTVIGYLSDDFRIVVFDLPGQGRARILSGSHAVQLDEQVEVVRAVCTGVVPHDTCYLAGASWGGIIALIYAARYPLSVDKLLLASFGIRHNEAMREIIRTMQQLIEDGMGERVGSLITDTFGKHLPDAFKRQILKQFDAMSHEQLLSFYAHTDFVHGVADLREVVNFANVQAETLIINGEDDPILNRDDIEAAAAVIPRCRAELIPRAGHFLHLERDEICERYRSFFAGQASCAARH